MSETKIPITEAARLRCNYSELRKWEMSGVDPSLLEPEIGIIAINQLIQLETVDKANLISQEV